MASIRERNGKFNVIYSYTDPDGKTEAEMGNLCYKSRSQKTKEGN